MTKKKKTVAIGEIKDSSKQKTAANSGFMSIEKSVSIEGGKVDGLPNHLETKDKHQLEKVFHQR